MNKVQDVQVKNKRSRRSRDKNEHIQNVSRESSTSGKRRNYRRNRNHKRKNNPNNKYYNMLLIGETGVGKSTFINAFANYIVFKDINKARAEGGVHLIPSKFNVYDCNNESIDVCIGSDENEYISIGESATQGAKPYEILVSSGTYIRLIDTPGIGDTRGLDQDEINFQNILNELEKYDMLHAICFLFKPNCSRLTVAFKYCLEQLLSKFHKSVSKNLLFVFTNSRSTLFYAGETTSVLKMIFNEINNGIVQFGQNNTFYVDNEWYKMLAAAKKQIQLSEDLVEAYYNSWEKSSKIYDKLLSGVIGNNQITCLDPHTVDETISVNDARIFLSLSAKLLARILEEINIKKSCKNSHESKLAQLKAEFASLNKQANITIEKLRKIPSPRMVVCTSSTCADIITVNNKPSHHYRTICENPCSRPLRVEEIGIAELSLCNNINYITQRCTICNCPFQLHMCIDYRTQRYMDTMKDTVIEKQIIKTKADITKEEQNISEIEAIIQEYEKEYGYVTQYVEKFALYVVQNSLIPINESFKEYIEYLIDREDRKGPEASQSVIKELSFKKLEFEEENKCLRSAIQESEKGNEFSAKDIQESLDILFSLQHFGQVLRSLHKSFVDNCNISASRMTKVSDAPKQENLVVKEFMVEQHLVGLTIGKSYNNVKAIKLLEGICDVVRDGNRFKVIGTNEKAVNEAIAKLKFVDYRLNLVMPDSSFLDNPNAVNEIEIESGICKLYRPDGSNKETDGRMTLILRGRKEEVKKAKELIFEKIKDSKEAEKMIRVIKNNPVEYMCEFDIDEDYIKFISQDILAAYSVDEGVNNIELDRENGQIRVTGTSKDAVEKASDLLCCKDEVIFLPIEFVRLNIENENGSYFRRVKSETGLKKIDFLDIESDTESEVIPALLIGNKESINKGKLALEEICFENIFTVPDEFFQYINKSAVESLKIYGILKIEVIPNGVRLVGATERLVEAAWRQIEIVENSYEITETSHRQLKSRGAALIREITHRCRIDRIKFTPKSVTITGIIDNILKAKEFVESLENYCEEFLFSQDLEINRDVLMKDVEFARSMKDILRVNVEENLVRVEAINEIALREAMSLLVRKKEFVKVSDVIYEAFTSDQGDDILELIKTNAGLDGIKFKDNIKGVFQIGNDLSLKNGKTNFEQLGDHFEVIEVPESLMGVVIGLNRYKISKVKQLAGIGLVDASNGKILINSHSKDSLEEAKSIFMSNYRQVKLDLKSYEIISQNLEEFKIETRLSTCATSYMCLHIIGNPIQLDKAQALAQNVTYASFNFASYTKVLLDIAEQNLKKVQNRRGIFKILRNGNTTTVYGDESAVNRAKLMLNVFETKLVLPEHLLKYTTSAIKRAEELRGVFKIVANHNNFEIYGSSQSAVNLAKEFLEILEKDLAIDVGKFWHLSKNFKTLIQDIKKSTKINYFRFDYDLKTVKVIGTKKSIENFDTYITAIQVYEETFYIPTQFRTHHFIGKQGCVIKKGEAVDGINRVVVEGNKIIIHASVRSAIADAYAILCQEASNQYSYSRSSQTFATVHSSRSPYSPIPHLVKTNYTSTSPSYHQNVDTGHSSSGTFSSSSHNVNINHFPRSSTSPSYHQTVNTGHPSRGTYSLSSHNVNINHFPRSSTMSSNYSATTNSHVSYSRPTTTVKPQSKDRCCII